MKKIVNFEPLMANRWIVNTQETFQNIPKYAVSDFKIETVDVESVKNKSPKKGLKLTLHFRNMAHWLLMPDDVMECKKVKIDFLDPTGSVVNYYDLNVEFNNLTLVGDYGDSSILTHEVTFWIKELNSMVVQEDLEKKVFEKYKKKKEEV